jgi:protein-disulfide isomerase
LGLDPDVIKERQKSPEVIQVLQQDLRDVTGAKVRATPSVFINGRLLKRPDLNGFKTMIDAEVQRLAQERP